MTVKRRGQLAGGGDEVRGGVGCVDGEYFSGLWLMRRTEGGCCSNKEDVEIVDHSFPFSIVSARTRRT